MGNRISKVYTKTGDNGTTGLGNGDRVSKPHSRVKSFGDTHRPIGRCFFP